MEFITKINNHVLTVKVLKKTGMKNTYLRVKTPDLIQISTNTFFTKNNAKKLIEDKKVWIEKSILQLSQNSLKDDEFLFLGIKHKNLDNKNLDIFYKNEAKKIIPPIVEQYSQVMNLYPSDIKFRKNKRTWGSCNYKNALNFNILLVKFPFEIIEYVVIHELSHIEHKNHSKNFWNLVQKYCPDYKKREKMFKTFL